MTAIFPRSSADLDQVRRDMLRRSLWLPVMGEGGLESVPGNWKGAISSEEGILDDDRSSTDLCKTIICENRADRQKDGGQRADASLCVFFRLSLFRRRSRTNNNYGLLTVLLGRHRCRTGGS